MSDHEEDDPVVATFNVFVNPTNPPHRKIHILHQSVRYDEGATPAFPRVPTELRLKPDSGVVEVDVPLDMMDNYDRDKGMQYGRALRDTADGKGSGAQHGLAGGFGIGAPAGVRKGSERDRERRNGDWVDEVRADRVLKNQTLGGIISKQEPLTYMIGIFQGGKNLLPPSHLQTVFKKKRERTDVQHRRPPPNPRQLLRKPQPPTPPRRRHNPARKGRAAPLSPQGPLRPRALGPHPRDPHDYQKRK